MTLDWAKQELRRRKAEQEAVQSDGTWDAFAAMKRAWAFRRKAMGYSRAKARAWMDIAERNGGIP